MQSKSAKILTFLEQHEEWNLAFQREEFQRHLQHYATPKGRLAALLHLIAYTQSQPKMEPLAALWERVENHDWHADGPSLAELVAFFYASPQAPGTATPWDALYRGVRAQEGMGEKTAALFVKSIIMLHRSDLQHLYFLRDPLSAQAPVTADIIRLPVDAVIRDIFSRHLGQEYKTFSRINKYLQEHFSPEQILRWDDLWFWGFFSQRTSSDSSRVTQWNPAKYWCQPSTDKKRIESAEVLCKAFIGLLTAS